MAKYRRAEEPENGKVMPVRYGNENTGQTQPGRNSLIVQAA
jgi:hypothetical protein